MNFFSSSSDDDCFMLHRTIFVESLKFFLCRKLILKYPPQGGGKKPTKPNFCY